MKSVAIHQPNFLPWCGYFFKIAQADVFVLLDDVQFTKNSYINRVRIKSAQGEQWLTVPVNASIEQKITDVRISKPELHLSKIMRTLETNYRRAPGYSRLADKLFPIFERPHTRLEQLNHALIKACCELLEIRTPLVLSSSYAPVQGSTERLVHLVRQLGGTQYISGGGGQKYQDESLFAREGIQISYSSFAPVPYPQLFHGDFIPGLSVIDALASGDRQILKQITERKYPE